MATPALKTALWRANLRNELGDDNYLKRQRDLKRAYRARKKLELAQQQAQPAQPQVQQQPAQPQVQQVQSPIQITQPPNKQTLQQLMALTKTPPPPRPSSRPMAEVVEKFISKSKASKPEVPIKPNKLKKLKLLLKQLNI